MDEETFIIGMEKCKILYNTSILQGYQENEKL